MEHSLVIRYIHEVWGSKDYFPGPQPVSIERRHFPVLSRARYLVCEKTDGERHMLVALRIEGNPKCFLVNRRFEMKEIRLNLPKKAYDGTILDGELYENTLMVYDAVIVSGHSVYAANLLDRLSTSTKLLKSIIYMKTDPYRLKMKTFYPLEEFKTFLDEYLPSVNQKTDGIVLTPIDEPVRIGTHETMFKWKPREMNTVDFLVKREPSRENPMCKAGQLTWRLYVQEKGKHYFESEIPPQRWTETTPLEDGGIYECEYVHWEDPMWWRPLKKREDKTHPNNRRTFYRTIVNIKEDIKIEEFLDCKT